MRQRRRRVRFGVIPDVAEVNNGHDAENEGEVDRAGDRNHDEHLVGAVADLGAAAAARRVVVRAVRAASTVVVPVSRRRRRQPPSAGVVRPRAADHAAAASVPPLLVLLLEVQLFGGGLQLGGVRLRQHAGQVPSEHCEQRFVLRPMLSCNENTRNGASA